ncbi:hypothetical protein [Desulfovirgula thermocuniculi]|uniref:hypothetical protein n=1 Tax=Desulfovirgula thermocuniculi TaxID=348842 RepID=UPI00041BD8E7|nr:hypothetical protein [Desulfovirgula thermocuniculi]
MVFLIGDTFDRRVVGVAASLGWGRMFLLKPPRPYPGEPWGFDNGAFRCYLRGEPFDRDGFLRRLERAYAAGRPYLAVAPDIVAGGLESLEFSLRWLEELPRDWPWYLAVQDGMGLADVEPVLHRFAGIFLGGTDAFKATAPHWAALARRHGKRFHYGRAGTPGKLLHAVHCGADSADSSFPLWSKDRLARFAAWWNYALRGGQPALWPPEVWAPAP